MPVYGVLRSPFTLPLGRHARAPGGLGGRPGASSGRRYGCGARWCPDTLGRAPGGPTARLPARLVAELGVGSTGRPEGEEGGMTLVTLLTRLPAGPWRPGEVALPVLGDWLRLHCAAWPTWPNTCRRPGVDPCSRWYGPTWTRQLAPARGRFPSRAWPSRYPASAPSLRWSRPAPRRRRTWRPCAATVATRCARDKANRSGWGLLPAGCCGFLGATTGLLYHRPMPPRTLAPAVALLVALLSGCVSDSPPFDSQFNSTDCPARPVDMPGADMSMRTFIGCDLRGANLRGADLRGSSFWWSDLRGADLRDAIMQGTDLSYADLRGADFRGADMTRARLTDVEMDRGGLAGSFGCTFMYPDGRCSTDLDLKDFDGR